MISAFSLLVTALVAFIIYDFIQKFQRWRKMPPGIVTGNGSLWQDNRRFTMRTLRDFGFGKTTLDGIISNEALALCDVFKKKAKDPFDLDYSVNVAVLNVIWKMTADEQYPHEDVRMANFMQLLTLNLEDARTLGPIQFVPILKYLYIPAFQAYRRVKNRIEGIIAGFKGKVDEHKNNFDPDNIRDYIDAYLQEMKAQQSRGEVNKHFSDLQLRVNIQNLFFAGSETTANTTRWAILFLLRDPKVQERIQAYLQVAVRLQRGYPNGVCTNQDVEFAGYTIPKGTIVMGNLWACHFDPKYWPDPFKFDPTRFLESDGTLKTKIPSFLPFSLGKRQCLGESLAKMELFIFITVFMQRFSFRLPEGATMPSTEPSFSAIVNRPRPFKIVAEERT
ncbi:unnamed protein product [Darwinula stevensoni]|uniref:Cytochrome P450 n=1 Tax=Darwinula stevensoni TaxID=69355 RepID=A0A7R8XGF0_9CRUS|nr:unnamed protein product [Darwinula stevensoni]CAG0891411.1 unnamed protein product [Darwinula stevensoni]